MARWMLGLVSLLVPAGLGVLTDAPTAAAMFAPAVERPALPAAPTKVEPAKAVAAPAPVEKQGKPLRIPGAHSLIIAPHGCEGLSRKFDLLIHFHGVYTKVEPQLMASGIDALYVIVNLGIGSGAYEDAFATKRSFSDYIEATRARINQRCGGAERSVGRIALSGWSAGYGGIYRSLARPADADRIDAVLLADGMHVGFEPSKRTARVAAMEPFRAFAERAETGEKLMAITHSSIVPPGYASTTVTANFLVDSLHVDSQPLTLTPPRPDMELTRRAERGSLFIAGYAGGDKHAHCTHLWAIGETLWSRLKTRWSRSQ